MFSLSIDHSWTFFSLNLFTTCFSFMCTVRSCCLFTLNCLLLYRVMLRSKLRLYVRLCRVFSLKPWVGHQILNGRTVIGVIAKQALDYILELFREEISLSPLAYLLPVCFKIAICNMRVQLISLTSSYLKRKLAGTHCKQYNSKCKYVYFFTLVLPLLMHLRSHIMWCATNSCHETL